MSPQDDRPITVLHVLEALRGGTSRHVVDVVRAVPEVRHHVAVPLEGGPATGSGALVDTAALDAFVSSGAVVHPVEMQRNPLHPANLSAVWKLRRLIRTIRPDVVHGHSSVGGALGRIAALGSSARAFYTPNGISPGRLSRLVERSLGPFTTTFVAVSESEGELARDLRLAAPGRIAVVPNGIDLDLPAAVDFDLRAAAGIPGSARIVGTVARLVPQKAPEIFVRVCAQVAAAHPDVHFVLIGLGPLQDVVDRLVSEAGIGERWHQIPHVPEAAAAIAQMDVFALLSAFEGGPYTPLEAMRAGTPVVLTDVVGNHDVVEPGVSGLVAGFGDIAGLAGAVNRILDDPQLAGSLADEARVRLEARFDARRMGSSLLSSYRQAVGFAP